MIEHLTLTFVRLSNVHLNALFLLGLILFAGAMGGRIFQKFKIPQVVGYIIAGIIFGFILIKILRKYAEKEKILVFSLCGILFALGLALIVEIDMLLAAMTTGIVLVNFEPRLSKAGEIMNKYGIDYLAIVDKKSVLLGFVEKKSIDSFVSVKLMEVEQKIASMA